MLTEAAFTDQEYSINCEKYYSLKELLDISIYLKM